ncbi:3,4-dihydroxy-2-butanone 4-phosphate synthase [Halodesulfurarchaeum formicicum]|uniref:3,4-dihydroxy-2-butanone 4-phosphate synthase n=1 Tax=Halodesulfurarchaeum formicicum TaxID=1873524 RepID=A0A1D8S6J4_9EURY|nr:3,4-dihydroxy-2-butanone-4-phosphate synthase [Halodesulfurarchaeum formicicum]AOW80959.1 3,4-dihydroxy-2-butanone 4-phosphate synthase [Halodesulfurarchaeum formicicum]APE96295.1 3,4-dihydroxy-2-butanone 4-phosphate synthase [Halodesulfurarchaeum formicicum]
MSSQHKSTSTGTVAAAVEAFAAGQPVLIHDFDDREGEVDMVYPAGDVDSAAVSRLRNDAGGLICVALGPEVADAFELPFLADEIDHPVAESDHLGYDERSSFSLTVNHRDTYTGITDADRALTISRLGEAAADPEAVDFPREFRAPGHVHLLRASRYGLSDRKGHTEMGVALAHEAGRPPAAVVCEMLDDETGEALQTEDARAYAEKHGIPYVDGKDLIAAFT